MSYITDLNRKYDLKTPLSTPIYGGEDLEQKLKKVREEYLLIIINKQKESDALERKLKKLKQENYFIKKKRTQEFAYFTKKLRILRIGNKSLKKQNTCY